MRQIAVYHPETGRIDGIYPGHTRALPRLSESVCITAFDGSGWQSAGVVVGWDAGRHTYSVMLSPAELPGMEE